MNVVLDAGVLIGALDGSDSHHRRARLMFRRWRRQQATALLSVINLAEVLVAAAPDRERLRTAREAIAALGVSIHQPGEAIGVEAARLRARHAISLADAFCLATAKHTTATVASFDSRMTRVASLEQLAVIASGPREGAHAPRASRRG